MSALPLRVLFFNEGNLGKYVLGQGQLAGALRTGLDADPSLQGSFSGLEPLGPAGMALATRPVPGLSKLNLDQRTLRWHLVQAVRARRALERGIAASRPDVVHVHSHSVALLSGAQMRRVPFVLSVDAAVEQWGRMPAWADRRGSARETAVSRMLERRAFAGAAQVVAWSEWARDGVQREEPRARVVAHHPGVDLERYRPAPHEPRERPRVLFIGGRYDEKGGPDLLAAMEGMLGVTAELDLVTPAEVEPRPGLRVHRLEPADPELLALHQQADVLCLPSLGDASPWVVLEALACGTPVVGTAVGAIPEMLGGGEAGLIVEPGDRRGLRGALDALLGDPARRREMGAAGRALAEARYDARRQFPLLAELLHAAAAGRRPV